MSTGKKQFRAILSSMLVFCIVLTMLPTLTTHATWEDEAIQHDLSNEALTLVKGNNYIVTQSNGGETPNFITVNRDFDGIVRLSGVNIKSATPFVYSAGGAYTANFVIELEGGNTLTSTAQNSPVIPVPAGATTRFRAKNSTDEDSLKVVLGIAGNTASIGGAPAGTIIFDSGDIDVNGANGNNSAAIGSSVSYSGTSGYDTCSIIINGGKVTAYGQNRGMGGGRMVPVGRIIINGGDVVSNGIGARYEASADARFDGGLIMINGGNVTCNGLLGIEVNGALTAGTKRATGSVVLTGGNIRVTGGIGSTSDYNPSADYLCLDSIVVLPQANISRTVTLTHESVTPPVTFAAGITGGTPRIGKAKNIFYMNEASFTSIGSGAPYGATSALKIDTPHADINVFGDISEYHSAAAALISAAYDERDNTTGSSSAFDMGITDASGDISLHYYNTSEVNPGAEIKLTASGCLDKIMADLSEISSGTVTLATSGGAVVTATPVPTPEPPPAASDIARLSSLTYITSFGEKMTVPAFLPSQDGVDNVYSVVLPAGKTAVYVEATAAHSKAVTAISLPGDPSADAARTSGRSIPIVDGEVTAIVTSTAQDGTQNQYTINFVVSESLPRTEDRVWFNDNRAAKSGAAVGNWNEEIGMNPNADDPSGSATKVISLTGDAFTRKNYLEISGETVISTRAYIPSADKANAAINFGGSALMQFADSGTYAIGTETGSYDFDKWMKLDFHIIPGDDEDIVDSWANTVVRVYIDGTFVAEKAHPFTYAQTVLGVNGSPAGGWGYNNPQLEVRTSVGKFFFDGIRIFEPSDFAMGEAELERHNDLAQNIKLDGTVTLVFNHDININTFPNSVKVYEDGVEFTPTSINIVPSYNNKIAISFAGTKMKPYTYYEFILDDNLEDITGRKISPEAKSMSLTSGGEKDAMPARVPPLELGEGEAYIMPDEFNTGYYSVAHYSEFKDILERYPFVQKSGTEYIISKYTIDKMRDAGTLEIVDGRAVFKSFKILGGSLKVTTSDVLVEDFYINSDGIRYSSNYSVGGGAKNVIAQDGELEGSDGTSVGGENVIAKRLHVHNATADGMKPSSGWLVESCYIHDLGHGYLAHADGMQVSGSYGGLTNDIRIYGNRIDMPPVPFINVANATFFLKLDFGPLINVDVQYNWFNGGGNSTVFTAKDRLLRNVTYKNNLMGAGFRYGHASGVNDGLPEDAGTIDITYATEAQDLNIPSAGSVVYKDESGTRIRDLADSSDKLTIVPNFANFTTNEQNIKVVAEMYDIDDNPLGTASPALDPIPAYTSADDYYKAPVYAFQDAMAQNLIEEHGITDFSFAGTHTETQRNDRLHPYHALQADWVINTLNNDPMYNISAGWWLWEHAASDADRTWFYGMKEAPYLPLNEQRPFVFNLPRTPSAGDYVKVSVYKIWDDKADELLRPADIIECSGDIPNKPELKISNSDIYKNSGGEYFICADVANTLTDTQNVSFIAAVYNGDKLVDVKVMPQTIAIGYDDTFAVKYTPNITLNGAYKVKVMVWNAAQQPLCAATEKAVGAIMVK